MDPRQSQPSVIRILVAAAVLVIVVAGLQAASSVLLPVLFAWLLAILGCAPLNWLRRRKVPGFVAALLVVLATLVVFTSFGIVLNNSVGEFSAAIPDYRQRLQGQFEETTAWLEEHGLQITASHVFDLLEPKVAVDFLGSTLRTLVATFSRVLLVLVIMLFMLFEANHLRRKLVVGLGAGIDLSRLDEGVRDVQRYLGIKTLTSAGTAFLVYGLLVAVGVKYSLLWALLVFALNYIPVVGSTVAALPPLLLTLIDQGPGSAAGLAIGYVVINVGISNFVEPWIMGRSLGLSPLVVFLSLVFWGWVLGPFGMLLAVPLTMIVKIALHQTEGLRWVAIVMGGKPKEPAGQT